MAKYYGKIGFVFSRVQDGVWTEEVVEKGYKGDLIRNLRSLQASDQLNDDINITNDVSIIADPYAVQNFLSIRYATFMGKPWKVNTATVEYPRIILKLGGLYNVEEN